ncbi:hypothetical protein KJ678_04480, partial [Patescibacteria group bacterium]|nr:hypothetical protein [Patescibacteria group bacterium]
DGKTATYNWALAKPETPAWFQTYNGDVHTNSYLYNAIPSGNFLIETLGGVCSAKSSIDLGSGSVGSSNDWKVESYNHTISLPSLIFSGSYDALSRWNDLEAGKVYELSDNEITSTVNYKVSGTGFAVIYRDGDLAIGNDIKSDDVDSTGLVIYVKGDVTVDKNAEQIDAIIFATGEITIESKGDKKDKALIVNGGLYGNKVSLTRNMYKSNDNVLPSETVNFTPLYLVGTIPQEFQQVKIYWKEEE